MLKVSRVGVEVREEWTRNAAAAGVQGIVGLLEAVDKFFENHGLIVLFISGAKEQSDGALLTLLLYKLK